LQPVIEDGFAGMVENLNRQIRRKTITASLFPGEASLLRLFTAQLFFIQKAISHRTPLGS